MKKRICLILLCGIVLLGICGCGKNEKNNENKEPNVEIKDTEDSKKTNNENKENNIEDTSTNKTETNKSDKATENKTETNKSDKTTENKTETNKSDKTTENKIETSKSDKTTENKTENSKNDKTTENKIEDIKPSNNNNENNSSNSNSSNTNNNTTEDKNETSSSTIPIIEKKVLVCNKSTSGTGYNAKGQYTISFENNIMVYFTMYTVKSFIDGYKAEEDSWTISNMESLKNNTRNGISGNIYIDNNTTYMTVNYDIKVNPELLDLLTKHTTYDDCLNYLTSQGMSCEKK